MSETLTIRDAEGAHDITTVRELFLEYANGLGFDLCFQNFNAELADLPGDYAPQRRGALFLAELNGRPAGCVALHACFGEAPDTHLCEMKRLFVRTDARGNQIGRKLVEVAMQRARDLAYTHMRLDTVPSKMAQAVDLYGKLGFYRIDAYRVNPMPDVAYMEAAL